jgi:hypothetical protein
MVYIDRCGYKPFYLHVLALTCLSPGDTLTLSIAGIIGDRISSAIVSRLMSQVTFVGARATSYGFCARVADEPSGTPPGG